MTLSTYQQMQRFRRYLLEKGLKYTRQRRAIALAFYRGNKHLSLPELLDLAKQREKSIGYATVYRTMKLLCDAGLATEHHFDDGITRFEITHEHHDHLVCTLCGKIIEFECQMIEETQNQIASRYGFRLLRHRHELYGHCEDCCGDAS